MVNIMAKTNKCVKMIGIAQNFHIPRIPFFFFYKVKMSENNIQTNFFFQVKSLNSIKTTSLIEFFISFSVHRIKIRILNIFYSYYTYINIQ